MKSLKIGDAGKQQTLICAHWKVFPPAWAGEDFENLRQSGTIDDRRYQSLQIWQRECGIMKMDLDHCPTCAHRRLVVFKNPVPVLRSPDGVEAPVVDSALVEAAPRHRHMAAIFRRPGTRGSKETAAWIKNKSDG